MRARTIRQKDLDSSCWSIQFLGKGQCKRCEFNNKKQCGGNTGNAKLIKKGLMNVKSKPIL
jgi:hypothetical protein